MYLLDTNICVHFMKNEYSVPEKLAEIGLANCYISEIAILELLYGIANSSTQKKEANTIRLQHFLRLFEGRILPIRTAFDDFAQQKTALRKAGTPISDFDLLIGCTALARNLTLVTRNTRELARIHGLYVENWIN